MKTIFNILISALLLLIAFPTDTHAQASQSPYNVSNPYYTWPFPIGGYSDSTAVKYFNSDGNTTTLAALTDYLVETNGPGIGRLVLPYGEGWPSFTPYPSNPISIEFTCGWAAAASIPYQIKAALLLECAGMYENREGMTQTTFLYKDNPAVQRLLASHRLWDEVL